MTELHQPHNETLRDEVLFLIQESFVCSFVEMRSTLVKDTVKIVKITTKDLE